MKTMHWILLPALLTAAAACNKASFGTQTGKKQDGSVIPSNGMVNPAEEPLDLSELEKNQDKAVDGPKAGEGQVLSKQIELTCDTSTGVTIEIDETSGGGKEQLKLIQDESVTPKVDIDESGKPIGGKNDDGKGGGKDDGKGGPLPEEPPVEVPQESKVTATVKGAFCPTSQNKLTVLFVVDYSGSMGRHIPALNAAPVSGYDPQINGSCGRLRAAEAVLGKIKSKMSPGDKIDIGMVPFAGGILTNRVMQTRSLEEFEALVTADTFCSYVVQDASFGYNPQNPGGIDGVTIDSSTNYAAGLTAAQSLLEGAYGRKVVYFISDGEPTSGGVDPVQAGVQAAQALRASVDNLELNALLLGDAGPNAKLVLEQVAGSQERVRQADSADQLADEILSFPDAGIDEQSGNAWLTIEPYKPRELLGLRYLAQDLNQESVWVYETQPFVLLGKPGEVVLNVVEVTARGLDGTTHSATVQIRYRQ